MHSTCNSKRVKFVGFNERRLPSLMITWILQHMIFLIKWWMDSQSNVHCSWTRGHLMWLKQAIVFKGSQSVNCYGPQLCQQASKNPCTCFTFHLEPTKNPACLCNDAEDSHQYQHLCRVHIVNLELWELPAFVCSSPNCFTNFHLLLHVFANPHTGKKNSMLVLHLRGTCILVVLSKKWSCHE